MVFESERREKRVWFPKDQNGYPDVGVTTNLLSRRTEAQKQRSVSIGSILFSGVFLTVGAFFGVLGILAIKFSVYEFVMAEWLNMRPGLPKYDLWKEPLVDVPLKLYIFNVTNSERFLSGEDSKLKLQEVGPITYLEKQRHTDVVFHENSTLSYTSSREVYFSEELSEPGILNKTIIVPNTLSLGIISYLHDAGYFVNLGAKMMMSHTNESPFKTITVYDMLWNNGRDKSELLNLVKSLTGSMLVPLDNMGMLAMLYKDFSHRVNVNIGTKNGPDNFFTMNTYDYKSTIPGFDMDRGDCNASLIGTSEGFLLPHNLTKDSHLHLMRKSVCRPVKLPYKEETQVGPLLGYKYILPDDICDRKVPAEGVECDRDSKPALPDGLCDMSRCIFNYPFVMSQIHYLGREGPWMDKLDGLKPDRERHESYMVVEPKMGAPIKVAMGAMASMLISNDISSVYSEEFQRFRGMVLPINWFFYELDELPPKVVTLLNIIVNKIPALDGYFGPILLTFSLVIGLLGVWSFQKMRSPKKPQQHYITDSTKDGKTVLDI